VKLRGAHFLGETGYSLQGNAAQVEGDVTLEVMKWPGGALLMSGS
jgi:hypothetical protein